MVAEFTFHIPDGQNVITSCFHTVRAYIIQHGSVTHFNDVQSAAIASLN